VKKTVNSGNRDQILETAGNGRKRRKTGSRVKKRAIPGKPGKRVFRAPISGKRTRKNAANTSARWDVLKKWFSICPHFPYTPFPRSRISGFSGSRFRGRKNTFFFTFQIKVPWITSFKSQLLPPHRPQTICQIYCEK